MLEKRFGEIERAASFSLGLLALRKLEVAVEFEKDAPWGQRI